MWFLLPHFLKEGRGKLDVYFTRVYNPVWTNPDGFSWMEVLTDEEQVGLHVALTPTWSETAWFADYVLPMGLGTERHDTTPTRRTTAQWLGFRQPVLRAAREQLGETDHATRARSTRARCGRRTSSGSSSPGGSIPTARSASASTSSRRTGPGEKLTRRRVLRLDVRELGARPAGAGGGGGPDAARVHAPLRRLRDQQGRSAPLYEHEVPAEELADVGVDAARAGSTPRAPKPADPNVVPMPAPAPTTQGRRPVGVEVDGVVLRGFPTPSRQARVLLVDAGRVGLARARAARLHQEPRPPGRRWTAGRAGAALDLPAADADPHPLGEREVARRDRAHQPAVDPPARRGAARRRAHRRPGPGRDRDRLLRRQGVGHRGHPARRRRLQPPHGPLEARASRTARSGSRWRPSTCERDGDDWRHAPATRASRPFDSARSRHAAHLVDATPACTRT